MGSSARDQGLLARLRRVKRRLLPGRRIARPPPPWRQPLWVWGTLETICQPILLWNRAARRRRHPCYSKKPFVAELFTVVNRSGQASQRQTHPQQPEKKHASPLGLLVWRATFRRLVAVAAALPDRRQQDQVKEAADLAKKKTFSYQ